MGQKMTWIEIVDQFPDEWVLVADFEVDEFGEVKKGTVVTHSCNKEDVFAYPINADRVGLWYTGESNFRGFRSHAERYSV